MLRIKTLLAMSWIEIITSQPLFQNTFVLRSPRVDNFAEIIKFGTMFIKTTLKDSKKNEKLLCIRE